VLETVVALALLLLLTRLLKLPGKLGVLLGVGTAICGGTAIVATAPVIEAEEKDVVFSVATVTLLGLIAMFTLPVIGHLMDLSSKAFGIWAGLAIHQTPQVIAAGFSYSPEAGGTATIVKLARVCLLAPVVFIIGVVYARQKLKETGVSERKRINYFHLFPMFVIGFLAVALVNTVGLLPKLTLHIADGSLLRAGVAGAGIQILHRNQHGGGRLGDEVFGDAANRPEAVCSEPRGGVGGGGFDFGDAQVLEDLKRNCLRTKA
jgi:uncharacterized integral membrane protein (TIGR00698 family)